MELPLRLRPARERGGALAADTARGKRGTLLSMALLKFAKEAGAGENKRASPLVDKPDGTPAGALGSGRDTPRKFLPSSPPELHPAAERQWALLSEEAGANWGSLRRDRGDRASRDGALRRTARASRAD